MEVTVTTIGKGLIQNGTEQDVTQASTELSPLLGGNNVNVITANDFQKLLAELQAKVEEKKKAAALNALSNELEQLLGIANGLEESQKAALEELAVETKKLEELVKAYTKTSEERKAEIEKKTELEKQRKKLESKISGLDKEIAATTDTKKLAELQAARTQAKTELEEVTTETSDADTRIQELDNTLAGNLQEQDKVETAIDAAVSKLNGAGMLLLTQAVRSTAAQVMSGMNGLLKEKLEDEAEDSSADIVRMLMNLLEEKTADMRDEVVLKRNNIV